MNKKYTCHFTFSIEVEAKDSWGALCEGSAWAIENLPKGLEWYQDSPEEN